MVILRHSDINKNILLLHLSGILVKYTYGISALVHCYKFNVLLTVHRIYPYNMNKQDALFTFTFFQ